MYRNAGFRRQRMKTMTAAGLITALIFADCLTPLPAFAAEAQVEVEETLYINLDSYGRPEKVNVVKLLSVNGNESFTDHGAYLSVENMTDETAPVLSDGAVTWDLSGTEDNRFYYRGEIDADASALPWTFDISYRLDGILTNADRLAGADGMVEIHIEAEPNEAADEYYRNNLLLVTAVTADLDECTSIEADSAQLIGFGSMQAAVFLALPGEEGDYRVRIASESFENTGVVMAMMPGTMDAFEHIRDLKEAEDTWRESGDLLYEGIESLLLSMEGMKSGVSTVREGLSGAESARRTWDESMDEILDKNDAALTAMEEMTAGLGKMAPHLRTAKEEAELLHGHVNDLVDAMDDMHGPLEDLLDDLLNLADDSGRVGDRLPALVEDIESMIALDARLQANEQIILTAVNETLPGLLEEIADEYAGGNWETTLINDLDDGTSVATASELDLGDLTGGALSSSSLMSVLTARTAVLEDLSEQSGRLTSSTVRLLDDVADLSEHAAELVDDLDGTIAQIVQMKSTLNRYYPEMQQMLSDSAELVEKSETALNSTVSALRVLQNTVRASRDDLDTASRDTLAGSLSLLDESLLAIDSTRQIRLAGRRMKDTLDEKLDEYEDENRFLFIDPSAEKPSFTSALNTEPKSIQILLRTEEISLEKEGELLDAETESRTSTPFERIKSVFVRIWQAVAEIFRDR